MLEREKQLLLTNLYLGDELFVVIFSLFTCNCSLFTGEKVYSEKCSVNKE